jgi:5-formyltetrahydrofolate cyclo-ligase
LDKIAFRTEIKSKTAALSGGYLAESDADILKKLLSLPEFVAAPRVFTYISIGREPDTRVLIHRCAELGKAVAVPVVLDTGEMRFVPLETGVEALSPGVFGIPTPDSDAPALTPRTGDLMVVPALCFDGQGYRLGRGGGYYDRYLAAHPVFSVGLCREALVADAVPRDPWDMRVSCLVTEKRIARPEMAPQK